MIEVTSQSSGNLIVLKASGKVTAKDYEQVIIPAIEAGLESADKIRMLYHAGAEFEGYTAGAMWDDAKLGVKHFSAFEKLAVVTDVGWMAGGIKAFRFIMPCPVEVFSNADLDAAMAWITA